MASISAIRTGLATRLGTITGLRTSAFMPDNPNPPIAVVMPSSVSYDDTFHRGMQTYVFNVLVIVGRVDERTAQSSLDGYVSSTGSSSIKLAIEGDKTLGGVVFDTRVTEMRNYGQLPVGEVTYLTAEFTILCYAD
jgi:hypothetical protein